MWLFAIFGIKNKLEAVLPPRWWHRSLNLTLVLQIMTAVLSQWFMHVLLYVKPLLSYKRISVDLQRRTVEVNH
jgi:hypothetical protein